MPLWHCPHCGTPQPESARCWVCRKSSTSCATCRHFRHAVAAQLGYCGLDRRRRPLRGDEMRGCWEGAAIAPIGIGARTAETLAPFRQSIAWTEVDGAPPGPEGAITSAVSTAASAASAATATEDLSGPSGTSGPAVEPSTGSQVTSGVPGSGRTDAAWVGLWGDLDP